MLSLVSTRKPPCRQGLTEVGDKSNHVATLHLAQMLYIWPFFLFFSAPLFLPSLVNIAGLARNLWFSIRGFEAHTIKQVQPSPASGRGSSSSETMGGGPSPPRAEKSVLLRGVEAFLSNKSFYPLFIFACIAVPFAIVRYNTIIHPFTLADNRHYMFYVFRRTILRPDWTRYLLIPIYGLCGRMCWVLLFGCNLGVWDSKTAECSVNSSVAAEAPYLNNPFEDARMSVVRTHAKDKASPHEKHAQQPPSSVALGGLDEPQSTSAVCPSTSTALLWLISTTLSLMTAPLVEPRYFILPWVFWRLLVPAWPAHECVSHDNPDARLDRLPVLGWLFRVCKKFDLRLVVETAWFIAINVATMYAFLHRPFYWRAPDGSLMDDGKLQRFMW